MHHDSPIKPQSPPRAGGGLSDRSGYEHPYNTPDLPSGQPVSGLDTLMYFAAESARFCKARPRGKNPIEPGWPGLHWTAEIVIPHLEMGGNVGVLAGVGDIGFFDLDENFPEFLERYFNRSTPYVVRANAPARGKIPVRLSSQPLGSRKYESPPLEWLWMGRQAVVAGFHPSGAEIRLVNPHVSIPVLYGGQVQEIIASWVGVPIVTKLLPPAMQKAPELPTDRAYKWLATALDRARIGNRNRAGFDLACQCRDDGWSMTETMRLPFPEHVSHAPGSDGKPYTRFEYEKSVIQAFTRSPRRPARRV